MSLRDGLKSTSRKGVFYREHPKRKNKNGIKRDREIVLRYTIGGKTRTESLGWESSSSEKEPVSEIEAEKLIVTFRQNHKSGTGPTSLKEKRAEVQRAQQAEKEAAEQAKLEAERRSKTVDAFFADHYLPKAKRDKARDTWESEERLYRLWIAPVIGHLPFRDITIEHLDLIKANMADGKRGPARPHPRDKTDANHRRNPATPLSNKSIALALALVRQVWNLAVLAPYFYAVGDWPGKVKVFKKPSIENMRQKYLTIEEATRLLDRLKQSSEQVHDYSLLSLHCGGREGELFDLTWDRVDFKKREVLFLDTKNGDSRKAFLTKATHAMLFRRHTQRKDGDGPYVFTSQKGGKVQQLSSTFSRVVKELGLNKDVIDDRMKVCFHTLRHTFASWVLDAGANLKAVQDLLGHKTLAMTIRYLHVNEDTQKAAVNRLGDRVEAALSHTQEDAVS